MSRVKVTGYIELEDNEVDPKNEVGWTEAAFLEYHSMLSNAGLDEMEFEAEDD